MKIQDLPDGLRQLAEVRAKEFPYTEKEYDKQFLAQYFKWEPTPEKFQFWKQICCGNFKPYYEKYTRQLAKNEGVVVKNVEENTKVIRLLLNQGVSGFYTNSEYSDPGGFRHNVHFTGKPEVLISAEEFLRPTWTYSMAAKMGRTDTYRIKPLFNDGGISGTWHVNEIATPKLNKGESIKCDTFQEFSAVFEALKKQGLGFQNDEYTLEKRWSTRAKKGSKFIGFGHYDNLVMTGNYILNKKDKLIPAAEFLGIKTMKKYTITRAQVKQMYDAACGGWKETLKEFTEKSFGLFSDTTEVAEDWVANIMGAAANDKQRAVLAEVFPSWKPEEDRNPIKESDAAALNDVFSETVGTDILAMTEYSANVLDRPDLKKRSFSVQGDYEVILHNTNSSTVIELRKK